MPDAVLDGLSGDSETLSTWIGAVYADLPVLRPFAAGLRRDVDAAAAGTLSYPYRETKMSRSRTQRASERRARRSGESEAARLRARVQPAGEQVRRGDAGFGLIDAGYGNGEVLGGGVPDPLRFDRIAQVVDSQPVDDAR